MAVNCSTKLLRIAGGAFGDESERLVIFVVIGCPITARGDCNKTGIHGTGRAEVADLGVAIDLPSASPGGPRQPGQVRGFLLLFGRRRCGLVFRQRLFAVWQRGVAVNLEPRWARRPSRPEPRPSAWLSGERQAPRQREWQYNWGTP